MAQHISAREARQKFSHILGTVHYGGNTVIIERSGKPMVAVIPLETYHRLVEEREARFQVVDRVRDRLPEAGQGQVERDVAKAVSAVRAAHAAGRP